MWAVCRDLELSRGGYLTPFFGRWDAICIGFVDGNSKTAGAGSSERRPHVRTRLGFTGSNNPLTIFLSRSFSPFHPRFHRNGVLEQEAMLLLNTTAHDIVLGGNDYRRFPSLLLQRSVRLVANLDRPMLCAAPFAALSRVLDEQLPSPLQLPSCKLIFLLLMSRSTTGMTPEDFAALTRIVLNYSMARSAMVAGVRYGSGGAGVDGLPANMRRCAYRGVSLARDGDVAAMQDDSSPGKVPYKMRFANSGWWSLRRP